MSSLEQRASDAVSEHPEMVILGFAITVLFLAVVIFLWSRRAARLEKVIEELKANRDALTHLLQRPGIAGRVDEDVRVTNGVRPVYSVADRASGAQAKPDATSGASAQDDGPGTADPDGTAHLTAGEGSDTPVPPAIALPTTSASNGNGSAPATASTEISATWIPAEEVPPAAAAWAASPARDRERKTPVSPFRTMSFEPPAAPAAPIFSFAPVPDPAPRTVPAQPAPSAPGSPDETVSESPFRPSRLTAGVPASARERESSQPDPVVEPAPEPPVPVDGPADEVRPRTPEEEERPARPVPAAPPQAAYEAWESLSRTTASMDLPTRARQQGDPAYRAWSEVTGAGWASAGADDLVMAAGSRLGNGHTPGRPNGHDNGTDVLALADLATPIALTPPDERLAVPVPSTDVADVPTADVPSADVPSADEHGGSVTGGILLVEDDPNVAKIYRIVLESKGHTVRHAPDGVSALDEVRKGRPDLVLLDVMMPHMNGILFLQALRAQPALHDVPVVILSNFREPRLVERAMALGALEYIVKAQTRPDVLVNAVPRWLAGERAFSA